VSLVPLEQVTQTHVVEPHACRRCGQALSGDDPAPYRHQVVDVPKVVATVREYQLKGGVAGERSERSERTLDASEHATRLAVPRWITIPPRGGSDRSCR
jgi:hypothetical protein